MAIQILRQANQMIPSIPESLTTLAILNILDPPPPPPAKLPATGTAEKSATQGYGSPSSPTIESFAAPAHQSNKSVYDH